MKQALEIVRKQLPTRVMPSWRYYSQPISLDPRLTGHARFAVQIDSGVGSISSRLSVNTVRRLGAGDKVVVTSDVPPGIVVGSMIDISRTEQAIVVMLEQTTEPDGSKIWSWTLDHELSNAFPVGATVNFLAFPVLAVRDVPQGSIDLVVDSSEFIVPGDTIFTVSKPAATLVSSPSSDVLNSKFVTQVDADASRWALEVQPVTSDISAGDILYVTAAVAYRSARIPLKDMSGPYLADMMGGKTFGEGDDKLTMSFEFFGGLGLSTVSRRNEVVTSLPVRSGDTALWTVGHGTIRARSQDHIELVLDRDGNFNVGIELPIETPISLDWIVQRGYGRIALFIDELPVIDMSDLSNIRWSGQVKKRIELRVSGSAFDNWSVVTNPVRTGFRSVQYSYVAQVKSEEVWSGTFVILKPLLKQLSDSIAHNNDRNALEISSGGFIQ